MSQMQASSAPNYAYNPYATYAQLPYAAQIDNPYAAAYGYDPYAAAYGVDPYTATATAYPADLSFPASQDPNAAVANAADPYALAAAYGYDPYALAAAYGSEFNASAYHADPSTSLTNYDPYASSVMTGGSDPYASASRSSARIGPDHASDPSATVASQYPTPTAMEGEALASGVPDSGLITLTQLKSSSEDSI